MKHITVIIFMLLSTYAYAEEHSVTVNNTAYSFTTKEDLKLFKSYHAQLVKCGDVVDVKMKYNNRTSRECSKKQNKIDYAPFAYELVKGRAEFVQSFIKSKERDADETKEDIEEYWDDVVKLNFVKDVVNDALPDIIKYAPNIAMYVRKNGNRFGKTDLTKSTDDIMSADEHKRNADEHKRNADELRKINERFGK